MNNELWTHSGGDILWFGNGAVAVWYGRIIHCLYAHTTVQSSTGIILTSTQAKYVSYETLKLSDPSMGRHAILRDTQTDKMREILDEYMCKN